MAPNPACGGPGPRRPRAATQAAKVNISKRAKADADRIAARWRKPTDLPDGTVIYREPVAGDDEETAEERAAIEAAIDEGLDDFEAGRFVDEETVRAKLRAYR